MKTQLNKKWIVAAFCLVLLHPAKAQANQPFSKAEIDAMIQHQEAELRAERPIYGVISLMGEANNPAHICYVGVRGHTNVMGFRPLPSQAFDAHLFGHDGKEIPKTFFYGHKFGQELKPDKEFKEFLNGKGPGVIHEMYDDTRRTLDFAAGAGSNHYWDFDVLKSFRIKEPGEYRLQVQVRLFTKDTNGVFQPFILPPVETKVIISESDLK